MTETRNWTMGIGEVTDTIAKLEKINARAAKKGFPGRYTWVAGPVIKQADYDPNTDIVIGYRIVRELTVEGEAPSFGGWSFIAALTYEDGALITRPAPSFEGVIDRAAIREGWCDHCRTERYRTNTYLVAHTDGRTVQVGSSCIKDFMGHGFSPAWADMATESDLDEIGGQIGGRDYVTFTPESIVTASVTITEKFGYVAASEVGYRTPTKVRVADFMWGHTKAANELREEVGQPTAAHEATAAEVIAWVKEQNATSEYMINMQSVLGAESVSERSVGLVASAPAAYIRATTERAEREAAPVSQYVGAVKDKVEFDATIKVVRYLEGQYGTITLIIMVDPTGNSFKWFASGTHEFPNTAGTVIRIKGTVKDHEEYNGVKSTVLTRCKYEIAIPA